MKKAYSYIRFSSPQQAKGDSYRRQNEAIKSYCTKHELELVTDAEYTFFDRGLSAYSGDHIGDKGQLARFLDCIRRDEIPSGSALIVESLDRLSRANVEDALAQFLLIVGSGVEIITLSDGMRYEKGKLDTMQLVISIFVMSRAHEESSIKAQRVKSAWIEKKEKAKSENKPISPNCPMWLRIIEGKYQVIEERADVVRRVFNMCIDGYGRTVIKSALNREGIKSFKGTTWGTSSIEKILNNRAVIGEYQPHTRAGSNKRKPEGESIKGYYPEIISETVFYAAKAASDERRITQAKRQPAKFNIWSKISVCGYCGANMVYVDKGDGAKGGKYLQCYETQKSKDNVCPNKRIKYEKAHEVFKQILTKIDSLSLVQDSSKRLEFELHSVKGAISDAESRHSIFDKDYNDTKSKTAMSAADAALNDIAQYKHRLEELKLEIANAGIFDKENFLELLDIESYEGRNQANRLMLRLGIKVDIMSDRIETVYYVENLAVYKQEGDIISEVFLNPEAQKRFLDNSTPDDLMRNKDLMAELAEGMDVEALVKAQILIEKFEEKLKNQNKT